MNEHAIFEEVGKNKLRPSTSMIRRKWGREIVALIERMWDTNPDARPAMPEVVRLLKYLILSHHCSRFSSADCFSVPLFPLAVQ